MNTTFVTFIINFLITFIESTWLNTLAKQIEESLNPYQITVFSNNTWESCNHEAKLRKIIQQFPNVIVNFQDKNIKQVINYSSLPIFSNPSYSSVNVILECDDSKSASGSVINLRLIKYIDEFVKISPYTMRPKSLIILLSDKNIIRNYTSVFTYAWAQKFLDLSLLEVYVEQALLYYFNPFYNFLEKTIFEPTTAIFPNKLVNVNGHAFRLPGFSYPPFFSTIKDKAGNIIDTAGLQHHLLKITSEKLNLTFRYTASPDTLHFKEIIRNSMKQMFFNEADAFTMFAMRFSKYDLVYAKALLEIDLGFAKGPWVAVVPILQEEKLDLPLNIFLNVIFVPVAWLFVIFLIYALEIKYKNSRLDLQLLDIFGLLLGIPIKVKFYKKAEKLIFVPIFFIYMYYSTIFFSFYTGFNVIKHEIGFDTLEEINESSFQIYTDNAFMFFTHNESNYIKAIKDKAKILLTDENCINMVTQKRHAICICPKFSAMIYMSKYQNFKKAPIKISKAPLPQERLVFILQGASPFLERFEHLFQLIYESGIYGYLLNKYEELYLKSNISLNNINNKVIEVYKLLIVLIAGYMIAITVFTFELIHKSVFVKFAH